MQNKSKLGNEKIYIDNDRTRKEREIKENNRKENNRNCQKQERGKQGC